MSDGLRRLGVLVAGVTVALASGDRAWACRCAGDAPESVGLELETVMIDGSPVRDLARWRRFRVALTPLADGTLQLSAGGAIPPQDEYYAPAR